MEQKSQFIEQITGYQKLKTKALRVYIEESLVFTFNFILV